MSHIEELTGSDQPQEGNLDGQTQKLDPAIENKVQRAGRAETRKLPAEPAMNWQAPAAAPLLGLTREETTWAALAHASILVTLVLGMISGGLIAILGVLIPAIIWYAYRGKSEYVVDQARQAFLFQIAGFVALLGLAILGTVLVVAGWAVSAVLVIVLIGLLLMPIMLVVTLVWAAAFMALPIGQVVYGCYAALETYNGRPFRYWWIADLIDRYQNQTR
jgi:uncharacterized Tic20 family protein